MPMPAANIPELVVIDLGQCTYTRGMEVQQHILADVQEGIESRPCMVLLEHSGPVITLGRRGKTAHILIAPEELARRNVEVHSTKRGGDVTFHGPGQLVAYPIMSLRRRTKTVHGYVHDLEEVIIRLLLRLGLDGYRRPKFTGVWIGDSPRKIAAIGVGVSRWVTYHGLSLNVGEDLSGFDMIVPCGIMNEGVTSLSRMLGRTITMDLARKLLIECMCEVFNLQTPQTSGR